MSLGQHATASRAQPIGSPRPQGRRNSRPRVALAARLTALAAPGGGEVQMLDLVGALRRQQIDARLWRPWEAGFDGLDCLHLFGSAPEHLPLVAAAQSRGIRVVLSTIAWFDLTSCWNEQRPMPARLWASGKQVVRRAMPRLPSWRRQLYHAVDRLLPNSQAEAEQLMTLFDVPAERITIVPNAADEQFLAANPAPFAEVVGSDRFVLCAGRIEPRKNQLGLIRALADCSLPMVILGDVAPGHERYAAACRHAASHGRAPVQFLPRLNHHDPLLASAYAACRCLVVPSWFETPGLVALEAAMTGTPLALTSLGSAQEYFGPLAYYAHPARERELREVVKLAAHQPRSNELIAHVRDNFTWRHAARVTGDVYASLC